MALAAGSSLGAYRIVESLGRGGMASVYKAYEPALDRYVALKVLPGEFLHDEAFAERFQREAKVVARLEHPNIIPIFAFGIEQGMPWMAIRLIAGGTLSGLLRERRLPAPRVAAILRGVAEALDYAHEKGVVHRDVKPQNVLLDEAERVYLADFGIARMLEGSSALTQTGMISGTPQYMAPEQAVGQGVDQRADIYALGIVAYEMLTGHVPFSADTPVAVLIKHVQEPMPLPAPSEFPEPLVRALLKAMAKNPDDRWPTGLAFVQALEDALAEPRMAAGQVGPATGTLSLLRTPATGVRPVAPAQPPTLAPATGLRPDAPPTLAPATVESPAPVSEGVGSAVAAGSAVGLLLTGLAVAYFALWHGKLAVAPEAAIAAPDAVQSAASGSSSVSAKSSGSTARAATRSAAADLAGRGQLAIDLEHGLKSGTLQVWVDDEVVLSESLQGRVTKKVIGITRRKGELERVVEVSPGSHSIRVQVAWDDNRKAKTLFGNFKAGSTRRLEVKLGGLRKNLSLEWK